MLLYFLVSIIEIVWKLMSIDKKRVLVVEDEQDINSMIRYHLHNAGYDVKPAFNGEKALELMRDNDFNLAIIDVLLPGIDGWEICRNIRSTAKIKNLPIIFLTALSDEADRIKGFDLGGDDFLTKPFSPRELVSRVNAILRRTEKHNGEPTSLRFGDIAIDFLKHQIRLKGEPVHLTTTEFRILQLLVKNEGRVYSRDELLRLMREDREELELGNVDVHVHHLRKKLEDNPKRPRYIQTVWGVGYRFSSVN